MRAPVKFARSLAAAAVITASCGILSAGVAAAANPSDAPQFSAVQPDGCFVIQDSKGVLICQVGPSGITVIGDYRR